MSYPTNKIKLENDPYLTKPLNWTPASTDPKILLPSQADSILPSYSGDRRRSSDSVAAQPPSVIRSGASIDMTSQETGMRTMEPAIAQISEERRNLIGRWWDSLSHQAFRLGFPRSLFDFNQKGEMIQLNGTFFAQHAALLENCSTCTWLQYPGFKEQRPYWPVAPYQENVRIHFASVNVIKWPILIKTEALSKRERALIDSWASFNFIDEQVLKELGIPPIEFHLPLPTCRIADGSLMHCAGAAILKFDCVDQTGSYLSCEQTFFFPHGRLSQRVTLGMPWLAKMKPILNFQDGTFLWPPETGPIPELPSRPDQQQLSSGDVVVKTVGIKNPTAVHPTFQDPATKNPTSKTPAKQSSVPQNPNAKTTGQPRRSERIEQLAKKRKEPAETPAEPDAMDIDPPEELNGPRKKTRR